MTEEKKDRLVEQKILTDKIAIISLLVFVTFGILFLGLITYGLINDGTTERTDCINSCEDHGKEFVTHKFSDYKNYTNECYCSKNNIIKKIW